jgi:hypothetical protein
MTYLPKLYSQDYPFTTLEPFTPFFELDLKFSEAPKGKNEPILNAEEVRLRKELKSLLFSDKIKPGKECDKHVVRVDGKDFFPYHMYAINRFRQELESKGAGTFEGDDEEWIQFWDPISGIL